MKILIIFIVGFINIITCIEFETPEYIIPCKKNDPNINECIVGSFNHLRPYLVKGIDEINLPSIEPLIIPKLFMENHAGAVNVKALFANTTVLGASNYTLKQIDADLNNWIIQMNLTIPRIEVRGKYEVIGQVLLFPLRSKGEFWAAFADISAKVKLYGKIVKNKQGIEFMKVEKLDIIDFNLNRPRFKVRDFVNSGNVVGQAMNQFLNNNAKELIEEMKPAAKQSISKHFKGFLNGAFLRIPLQVWLKES